MTTVPKFPPRFKKHAFPDEPATPLGYHGTNFNISVVLELIDRVDFDSIRIGGATIRAVNIQFEQDERNPVYPIYFEVTGRYYHYVFSIWSDRFQIEVLTLSTYSPRSVMFPVTEEQLRQALASVVGDCVEAQRQLA